jgi:hypothetical protein
MKKEIKFIAFYLPQYHPIPENDLWWGKGFTEWTNVAKAKPLYFSHYQPHVPADLGFYDLRVPESREAQADLAAEYGIGGFCYYHYWFAGKRLLERPFSEVLKLGRPDFPFCLCWANQTWTGIWHGAPDRILIKQTYSGYDDHRKHFDTLFTAFSDKRYITVDGKPLLLIYRPQEIPEVGKVLLFWRDLAKERGLKGLYIIGYYWGDGFVPQDHGFDGSLTERLHARRLINKRGKLLNALRRRIEALFGIPKVFYYEKMIPFLSEKNILLKSDYPCIIPNWDNTPRSGKNGLVLHGSTPDLFRVYLRMVLQKMDAAGDQQRIIFIKSWNEWAEGNHLEPDLKFGRGYLDVIKEIYERVQI